MEGKGEVINRLKEICERASPGPWFCREPDDGVSPGVFVTRAFGVKTPPKFYVAFMPDVADKDARPDARFIATFNPDLVAKLLAVVEAANQLRAFIPISDDRGRKLTEGHWIAEDLTRVGDALAALEAP